MNYDFLKRIILFLAVIVMILTFYYFMDLKKEEKNNYLGEAGQKVLLKVENTGGHCTYGLCYSELFIYQDGAYLYKENQEELKGSFSEEEIKKLEELIKAADFNAIKSKKFSGQCPIEYDGSELIYTFYQPNERIASCEFEIDEDSALFKYIGELLNKIYLRLSSRI